MAATGYTPISLYYSTTAAATPSASNLTNGELAINITDGKLFYKDNAGVVQTLVSKNATVTSFSAGTTGLTPSTATSGAVTLAGTLNLANGGTGSTTAAGARTNLGATTAGSNLFTLTNPSAITFLRVNADNTVSALDAATYRTAIGATTLGGNMFTLTNPSAITFPRFNADNTVSALDAATYRTAIGGTTVGQNFYTLANPSAITFIRVNADNTVSALDAATFRTAIGAGTGGGSVSSVSGTGTVNGITLTGTVTTTGSLTLGGTLSGVSLTTQVTGTLPIANGGTGQTTATQAYAALRGFTTTVSSASAITLTVSSATQQEITGSTAQTITLPVTTTLATGWAVEIINNSSANITVNSSGGNLVGTVIPGTTAHCVCVLASGTTAASWDFDFSGFSTITGTGANVMATSPTLVTPALGTPTSGTLTSCTGLPLTTGVTGTLPVANGGTGATSLTANNVILGNGTSAVQVVAPGTSGNVLTSNGTTWVSQAAGGDSIGTFKEFAGDTTTTYPGSSWLRCAGDIVSQSTYSALYAKLGLLANNTTTAGIKNNATLGSPYTISANSLAYGDSIWVLGTTNGLWTSTDGNKWSVATGTIQRVVYGTTSLWMGLASGSIYTATSPTGTWTLKSTPSSPPTRIAYNAAAPSYKYAYTDSNGLYTSTDAVTWTYRAAFVNYNLYAWNGLFFATGYNDLETSTDGVTWTSRTHNMGFANIYGVGYAAGQTNKYIAYGTGGTLASSTDGVTWTARTSNTSTAINAVTYNGTQYQYFLNSPAGVGTSTDGVTWTYNAGYGPSSTATVGATYGVGGNTVVGVTNGAGTYGSAAYSFKDIYTTGPSFGTYSLSTVCDSSSNTVLAIGIGGSPSNYYVITSTDNGTSWVSRTGSSSTLYYNTVAYGAGLTNRYLVAGNSAILKTSTDLVTWTTRTPAAGISLISNAVYGAGLYVIAGQGTVGGTGYVQTSTDGVTWAARTANITGSGTVYNYGLIYAADQTNKFIAVFSANSTNYSVTSTDGITWATPVDVGGTIPILGYGNGIFVRSIGTAFSYSYDAVTWYSSSFTGVSPYAFMYSNGLFLCVGGTGQAAYSWDGNNWTSITTGTSSNIWGGFTSNTTFGFYGSYLMGVNRFNYNTATDFALPLQTNGLAQPRVDKLFVKAL